MARISKKGLDYFPMDTHFMQDRAVRRLMKQEGDNALSVLLAVYSYLYDGEGYYLRIDKDSFEDIAATFYHITAEQVTRVVEASVRIGLFDERLYAECGILTSAAIQRQFLFVKKRAAGKILFPDFNLLTEEEDAEKTLLFAGDESVKPGCKNPSADGMPVQRGKTSAKSTQRKEKESIAEQNREKNLLLLNPPPSQGEERMEKREESSFLTPPVANDVRSADSPSPVGSRSVAGLAGSSSFLTPPVVDNVRSADFPSPVEDCSVAGLADASSFTDKETVEAREKSAPFPLNQNRTLAKSPVEARLKSAPDEKKRTRRTWTLAEILSLTPPADGVKRNYAGLLENLRLYSVPPDEQYAIIRKSNYGAIGHSVWKGFCTLRGSGGKIRLPGRYLLSL